MLKNAKLYEDELKRKMQEVWYNQDYMYYSAGPGDVGIDLPESNYNCHCFVSVDDSDTEDEVIGYISYSIDWESLSTSGLSIISFDKGNIEFGRDLNEVIYNIFYKFNLNRLEFWCFDNNPALSGYRAYIRKNGGREVGTLHQVSRLNDGKLHDQIIFEILKDDFKGTAKGRVHINYQETELEKDKE